MDYKSIAKRSFKTKLILYLFNQVINNSQKINLQEFIDFKISKDLIKIYTTEYWQEFKEHSIRGKSIAVIEREIINLEIIQKNLILSLEKNYIDNFEKVFKKKEFDELVAQKFCQYCKIEKNQIERLVDTRQLHKKNFRGLSLEIDRLDSNDEYKKDNCVIACYWCNNAKTDEFTPEEFIPVAEKIHEIWKKRLNGN